MMSLTTPQLCRTLQIQLGCWAYDLLHRKQEFL